MTRITDHKMLGKIVFSLGYVLPFGFFYFSLAMIFFKNQGWPMVATMVLFWPTAIFFLWLGKRLKEKDKTRIMDRDDKFICPCGQMFRDRNCGSSLGALQALARHLDTEHSTEDCQRWAKSMLTMIKLTDRGERGVAYS